MSITTTPVSYKKLVLRTGNELQEITRGAEQLRIAVALLNKEGLDAVLEDCLEDCHLKILVGVDLPTPAAVLQMLLDLGPERVECRVMLNKETFHPKVYIATRNGKHKAVVGSGNCTKGGLFNNTEMALSVADDDTCEQLTSWFDRFYALGTPLTSEWLALYAGFQEQRASEEVGQREDVRLFKMRTGPRRTGVDLKALDFTGQFFQFKHYNAFTGTKPYNRSTLVGHSFLEGGAVYNGPTTLAHAEPCP